MVCEDFAHFDSSHIEGRISVIPEYSRPTWFKINEKSTKYRFNPLTDKSHNDGNIFSYLATPGDSVYKRKFSDSLILFKNDKTYYYKFQHPNCND